MAERHLTRQAVFVIIRNDKDEILLQQRANSGFLDGYWDFPSGHVEYGESLLESAIRETVEEVGVAVKPEDLRLVHIEQFFVENDYVNYTFEAVNWSGTPKIGEPEKCSAIKWFATDSLPAKCVNAVRSNEAQGFSRRLTFSVTDASSFNNMIGEVF